MELSNSMEKALNDQLGLEIQSWYAYLGMAAYCEGQSLDGFAAWLRAQADEEQLHAMKFYTFVLDRGASVTLGAIEPVTTSFGGVLEAFESALAHEQKVSKAINNLYGVSVQENDFATQAFLNWFVTEQIEEEKVVGTMVENLKRVGVQQEALLMLDREAGARSTTPA